MDDYLGGANTKKSAMKLRDELRYILQKGGFYLRKWTANDFDLLKDLKSENDDSILVLELENRLAKILGLLWCPEKDVFQYKAQTLESETRVTTKRDILSLVASLFDPLSLVGPIVIKAKILMQKLWKLKIDWDEVVPSEVQEEWRNYLNELRYLGELVIPWFLNTEENCIVEIHGFADASLVPYGACLYVRVTNNDGLCTSRLICAKSKVSPLKIISLPRLELCAAVVLAKLADKIISKMFLKIQRRYFWSDSSIVLAWITSSSFRWQTFVAHRVGDIQDLTMINEWNHVGTKDNPADIISRGCNSKEIVGNKLWWNGPSWLVQYTENWPKVSFSPNTENIPEERKMVALKVENLEVSILERFSSWNKLLRIISYCMRFKKLCLKSQYVKKELTVTSTSILSNELREADKIVIKMTQRKYWYNAINSLLSSGKLFADNKMQNLQPFLDLDGIIHVGGRLKNAVDIDIFQKQPILVPANSHIAKLILLNEHLRLSHAGPQAMLAHSRLEYWILQGRNMSRHIFHKCIRCFWLRPTIVQPIMGDLPVERVETFRAFKKCGVDFAGPVKIKNNYRRNSPTTKGYICLFVCFSTRAVHIELVSDLSTDTFLNALQRFFSHRGISSDIYSDNATNFVGANKKLQELHTLFQIEDHQNKIYASLSTLCVNWHFIPPRSPHFGGLWEASVKSLKIHLNRVLENACLTHKELNTIIIKIEAVLNSRPLTPIFSHPSDMSVLTLGHFLVGEPLCALPEPDLTRVSENRLKRWQQVAQLSQQVCGCWRLEYLAQLQTRTKWCESKGPILVIGTVVLVKEDGVPPFSWVLGRVVNLHAGKDSVVRIATVRIANKEFQHAMRKLCPLPFNGNSTSP